MKTRSTPVNGRRMLAALTAVLIGISGSVALATPSVAETLPAVTVTVTPSTDIDTTTETSLEVSGAGFVGAEPVGVALVTESDWTANGAAAVPVVAVIPEVVDGSFVTTLEVPAATLDPTIAYGIVTAAATDRTFDSFTVITLAAVGAEDEPVLADEQTPAPAPQQRVANFTTVAPGNVTGGTATWGLSTYLNSANLRRPNPLAAAYVAPAAFDASSRLSSWGSAIGTVNSDGSASLAFDGTSVNFAPTGGGWLRISDVEANIDASGNGSVTGVVAYGTAPGAYPNITYDAAQAPVRGPERITLVTLSGNAIHAVRGASTATWADLAGAWSTDFTAFLAGDAASGIAVWSYAPTVSSATDRTPRAFSFSVSVPSVATATVYDQGTAQWGLSTYLNSMNPGRPNPLASGYVAPASFSPSTLLSTWGNGSATVEYDGSARLDFHGTSVNFAPTGGGWLAIKDVQATLDASGNGVVSGIVSYGTAPGTYPNIVFDPNQAPANGPARVNLVVLTGNSVAVTQTPNTAKWAGLAGTWSSDFSAFLAGSGVTSAWAYATTVSSAAGRTPLAFTFDLGIVPPPAVTTTTALTVSPTADVVSGATVTLSATVAPAAAGTVQFRNGSTVLGSASVAGGVASVTLSSLPVGSYSAAAYFTPTDASAYTPSQSAALALSVTAPVIAQAGSLIWGLKQSLQSYVLGGGSISTSAGAGSYGSSFLFPQESSAAFDQASGLGTSAYRGAVTFSYPAHGFSIALSNPRVVVSSPTVGSLVADVTFNGTTTVGVNFATLFLGAATKTSSGGSTTFSGAPAALTSAGAATFQGFYSAGETLDPVTFVVGSAAASFASTSASAAPARTPAATPPSSTGITVTEGTRPVASDEITITAEGFQPNEEGILVVIYSEPTLLDANGKADANGTLTWTGRLPAGLTGSHTLTFQGSVNRGVAIEIAPRVQTAAEGCPVDGATLTWGFKESFRSYISGSIANGEWTVADGATYDIPNFGWSEGTGAYDTEGGLVAFTGSVNFTGHGGVLNTTVANPQIKFIDENTAVLLLDVSGTTQDGATVSQQAVEFVDIDLAGVTSPADGTVTVTDAPTTLTAAGAAAFGTYSSGEQFDTLSFTLPLDASCSTIVEATDAAAPVPTASTGPDLTWVWILIAVVLLVVIAAVTVILVRRRRAA